MKKLIALTALLSMSVAFAADDVVYGTFVLNSSEPELILCVPWINPGSTNGEIPVKDLIQTSTLEAGDPDDPSKPGDQLFYYDNGYKAWQVQEVEGKKVWEGFQFVKKDKEDNVVVSVGAGAAETLKRGNAVVLKRVFPRSNNNIVINGQFVSGSATMTMARGEKEKDIVYSLIAPASPDKATELNAGWNNLKTGDCIILGLKPYFWSNTEHAWCTRTRKPQINEGSAPTLVDEYTPVKEVSIPAGQGAWFMSQGTGDAVTWEPTATKEN